MGVPNVQWTYVVIDADQGKVMGTDSDTEAAAFAASDEYFVINTKTNQWLMDNANTVNIPPTDK